jgi:sulfur relay (sulfurtransferase) DsrF/TusC family protein
MINKDKMVEFLKIWLPTAIVITALCGLVYLAVQQNLRMGANDPQIQMAEDAALALASGQSPASLVQSTRVDIAKSLSPYLVIYDDNGNVIAFSGVLDGQVPPLPDGVLAFVKTHGQDRITMQPRPGVRMATVIQHYQGETSGFVLAGRSLREVEVREDQALLEAGITWALTIFATLVVTVLLVFVISKKTEKTK